MYFLTKYQAIQKPKGSQSLDISQQFQKNQIILKTANNFANGRIKRERPLSIGKNLFKNGYFQSDKKNIQQQRMSYLETLKSLMITKQINNIDRQTWKNRSRIQLPHLQQNQQSKFTMLQPMSVTSDYLQESANLCEKRLKQNMNQALVVKKQLQELKQNVLEKHKQVENYTFERLNNFRNQLKYNKINHQSFRLQMLQQTNILTEQIRNLQQIFDNSLERNQNLQQFIFNSLPFQLKQDHNNDLAMFRQKLF